MIEISEFSQINQAVCDMDLAATKAVNAGQVLYVEYYTEQSRKMTKKQRGALHVWCEEVASVFNEAGMYYATRVKFNGETVYLDWDKDRVKDDVYKPALEAITGKRSTEDQDTVEPSVVAATLQRHFALNHGLNLPSWPSIR